MNELTNSRWMNILAFDGRWMNTLANMTLTGVGLNTLANLTGVC
jgi:hypothetical protein